ncbi:MAG: hypothetical protein ABEJ26_01235 [Halosimplex sp.]
MQSLDAAIDRRIQGSSSRDGIEFAAQAENVQLLRKSPANPPEAGKISVTVDPSTGSDTNRDFWLGTVRYQRDGETVAYQGGGVWRKTGNGSVAVSSPGIQYRTAEKPGTVVFPIVTVDGSFAGSELQIETANRTELLSTLGLSNPVKPGTTITVEIRSEYYHAWASELKSEFGEKPVTTDPDTDTVTLTMKAPTSTTAPSAVLGTNVAGSLTISNFGETDSYDSRTGPYPGFPHDRNADVLTKGAIAPSNKFSVRGDVIAENGVVGDSIPNKVSIYGRTILGDDPTISSTDYLTIEAKKRNPTFHKVFSTKDNLALSKNTKFGGDVLVGGNLKISNEAPKVKNGGDVVVMGEIEQMSKGDFTGDVLVHGDAHAIGNKGVDIDGDLVANGHVKLKDNTHIHGDLVVPTGSSPDIDPSAQIDGSVRYVDFSNSGDALDTAPTPITPDVPARQSAKTEINSRSLLSNPGQNDNGGEPVIDSSDELDFGGTPDHTLESGEYYLDELNVPSGETLTLDTSSGDVVIYVSPSSSTAEMRVAGRIEVTGSDPANRARIYVDDTSGGDSPREFYIDGDTGSDGEVTVPADKSPNLWVYLKPTAEVNFNNHAVFQGVVYGANDAPTGGAEISLSNHADVYGALVGDVTQVPNHARVHYDEALASSEAFSTPSTVAPIDFVYFHRENATVDG